MHGGTYLRRQDSVLFTFVLHLLLQLRHSLHDLGALRAGVVRGAQAALEVPPRQRRAVRDLRKRVLRVRRTHARMRQLVEFCALLPIALGVREQRSAARGGLVRGKVLKRVSHRLEPRCGVLCALRYL